MGVQRLLLGLFFFSGLTALIYEILWSRYLGLFVGSAATAQLLVLSLFMGGMSAGAFLAGRMATKFKNAIVAYAVIEMLIGGYALVFVWLYRNVTHFGYSWLFPQFGQYWWASLVKWTMAGALIVLPCVSLGMTFPLLATGLLRKQVQRSGKVLASLYFSNTLGAAAGAMVVGTVAVPVLGLPKSLIAAGALNGLIGVVAWNIASKQPSKGLQAHQVETSKSLHRQESVKQDIDPIPESEEKRDRDQKITFEAESVPDANPDINPDPDPDIDLELGLDSGTKRNEIEKPDLVQLLLVAGGTGAASFMYEVGWNRLLAMILGSATRSFEIMLSAFLLGLACGGYWLRRRVDRASSPILWLAVIQLLMGMAAVATLPFYRLAVLGLGNLIIDAERTENLWALFNGLRYFICLLIMFPATFCAGMTLPLITYLLYRFRKDDAVVGYVYAGNTLGSILGIVIAGICLLPLIGIRGSIIVGACLDLGLGWWLLKIHSQQHGASPYVNKLLRNSLVGALMLIIVGFKVIKIDPMVLSATVFRSGQVRLGDSFEILSYVDGRTASISVAQDHSRPGYHTLYTNGKPDASVQFNHWSDDRSKPPNLSGDEPTQMLVGLIPMLSRPQASEVAVIGLGSGVTSHVMLASPHIKVLDTVEIEPEMVRGAKWLEPVNRRVFKDPRSRIVEDDAKVHFSLQQAKYDLIVSQPSNPWVSGVANLFTTEFYRQILRYLKPNGVFAQWVQGYELSDELLMSVLAGIDQHFNSYWIYQVGGRNWLIVAAVESSDALELDQAALQWPELEETLKLLEMQDVDQFASLRAANRQLLHPSLKEISPHSDDDPILDLGGEKARFMRKSANCLYAIRATALPILPLIHMDHSSPVTVRPGHRILRDLGNAQRFLEDDRSTRLGQAPQSSELQVWRSLTHKLKSSRSNEKTWYFKTIDIYRQLVPWIDITDSAWWAEVVDVRKQYVQDPGIRLAIQLLDAVVRRDPQSIQATLLLFRAEASSHRTSSPSGSGSMSTWIAPRWQNLIAAYALHLQHEKGATDRNQNLTKLVETTVLDQEPNGPNCAYRIFLSAFAPHPSKEQEQH